ncbi:putative sulfoacetate transporter SauU [Clostridium ljungdahlii DSM 13528]|uniref:Predicted permease n=1 Tax=Clostridium ljungdahlii (strain ATCC 55383 / DSM 13528 / PETC) TaxID=748727 RepID=D8GTK1_CLOLD|nr:MFS transporter [Clostridium ljungdahlii]ADK14650.1 predicted permease [Clostridium ljungdahlii DSM 13528]OAA85888.1 putative sulfoacetate transporter SauU [Clostridium ljungdahlii DSM 13528]
MNTSNIKIIYTIFVFVALAAFDNIIIGLFPPLFSSIAKDLNIQVYLLGIASAVNILVTSLSSICWGYLAGKFNRKRLIMIGTVFWSASVYLTSRCGSYTQLFIFQFFTGLGLGCIASIGFSVLTDYIPYKFRGMLLSLWGMSQGFGGIVGALMASLIAPATSWRKPFEVVSIIGFLLIIMYFFIREPNLGESEPELQDIIKAGYKYNPSIEFKYLYDIISRKSNVLLFLQSFFMNITTGSLIWLPTLYISKIQHQGYSMKTAIIASGYLFAIFQLGGLTSPFFGYLGDILQEKTYKGRSLLTSFFIFITMIFYIAMFLIPMNKLSLPDSNNSLLVLLDLLRQIIMNPWISMIFLLSFLASAAQSANTPNWLALITDVNLPEYRGIAFSIANLANGLGRAIGNAGVGVLLSVVSLYVREPQKYIITLSLFELFLIPSSLFYIKMSKNNEEDINEVKSILRKRAKLIK